MKHKIGERIRKARMLSGLSQQNIADELGLTVASYSNIERGITDITVTRLIEISTILNVSIQQLLSLDSTASFSSEPTPEYTLSHPILTSLALKLEKTEAEINKIKDQLSLVLRKIDTSPSH
jgi:transcriptional regulator with XRE-family HTH domain